MPRAGRLRAKVGLDDPGIAPDRLRRPLRDLLAVIEHHDALGDVHHHVHVVLDEHDGLARAVERPDLLLHLVDHRRIDGGGRLVEQDEVGVGHERGGKGEELALAIGQASRGGAGASRRARPSRGGGGRARRPRPRAAARRGRRKSRADEALLLVLLEERHQVLERGEAREHADELEGAADAEPGDRVGRGARHVAPAEGHASAVGAGAGRSRS